MTRYIFLSFLLALSACAEFPTGRSFLSEMEHDDSSFYGPGEDFPVVGGDAPVEGMSMDEYRRNRLPRTAEEKALDREGEILRQELRALESLQSEDEQLYYQKYKKRLATNSERIFFLKLPRGERKQYLQDRGFLGNPHRSPASVSQALARRSEIGIGMTKDDVMASMGRPARVEVVIMNDVHLQGIFVVHCKFRERLQVSCQVEQL